MQTSYSVNQAAAQEGQIADSSQVQDIMTGYNPGGLVLMGKYVCKASTGDANIQAPALATDITAPQGVSGVVVRQQAIVSNQGGYSDGSPGQYPALSAVPVMRKGRIWVVAVDQITEGTSTVNVRYSSGASTVIGSFSGAAEASKTAVLPGAKWLSSTTAAGQLALLQLDL